MLLMSGQLISCTIDNKMFTKSQLHYCDLIYWLSLDGREMKRSSRAFQGSCSGEKEGLGLEDIHANQDRALKVAKQQKII